MPKRRQKKLKVSSKKVEVRILSTREDKASQERNQAEKENINKVEFDAEKIEREKRLFMWVGISSIMVVFFVLWIFNLKYQFRASANHSGKNNFNWEQTRAQLDQAMGQIKQSLAQIKQIQTGGQSDIIKEPELSSEQLELLKGKLMGEAASSTTATSTKK